MDAGDDHDVERVIVKSDGPRQESVVDWEDNRRGKDAVQHQKSCLLIELVLSVGSFGDFDDGVDSDWRVDVFLDTMHGMLNVLRGDNLEALPIGMDVVVEVSQSTSNEQS